MPVYYLLLSQSGCQKIDKNCQRIITSAALRCEIIFRLVMALVSAKARAAAGEPAGARQSFSNLPVLVCFMSLQEVPHQLGGSLNRCGMSIRVSQCSKSPCQSVFQKASVRQCSKQSVLVRVSQLCDLLLAQHLVVDANIINQAGEKTACVKSLAGTNVQAAIRR